MLQHPTSNIAMTTLHIPLQSQMKGNNPINDITTTWEHHH